MTFRLRLTLAVYIFICCVTIHLFFKDNKAEMDSDAMDNGQKSELRYTWRRNGSAVTGAPFHLDMELMRKKGFKELPLKTFAKDLNDENWENIDFTFMTGSSANHFQESRDAVASIQKFFPDKHILYYDWGLYSRQVEEVKSWCSVEYRKMVLDDFAVVKDLNHSMPFVIYAAKIISINHALQDFDGVFWLDASVRFIGGDLRPIFKKASENGGLVFISRQFHSSYSVTHPKTYEYLPTDKDQLKRLKQVEAMYFIYKSEKIYQNVAWWLLLCALEKECVSPSLNLKCSFPLKEYMNTYVGCHRYDQAAVNILAANHFDYDDSRYYVCMGRQGHNTILIRRRTTKMYDVQMCTE
ncbi:hypothetical protein CAPTEDRAFT_199391 [Capitella teleta]|uniref:Nucleotide-diphospho-sugar transferase domain-containing protein n=1 Tax=Capitella teleta TaxID=283909 RepID=R7V3H7_CAPTE|nr:hypothetical protein CAPTEDRAFT_199391 [Capitella teleta]|eukprot:ELU10891.1 hypothetical protein CAPTEDRAFT_199391 [Capitella teleta]